MSHPFPKNQSPKDAKLVKNVKMANFLQLELFYSK